MTRTDTIFHSDIFLTFGPRLALHQKGEMSVSFQSRHKQTICGFRRWSPCTTSLRCMSQLLAQSRHPSGPDQCPLLGVKRTCHFAPQMSAYNPKRTWAPFKRLISADTMLVPSVGGDNEAARVRHVSRRCGGVVGGHRTRTAAGPDASYRRASGSGRQRS